MLPGDTPLLRAETIAALVAAPRGERHAATVLTAALDDPTGYGRVVARRRTADVVRDRRAARRHARRAAPSTRSTPSIYCFRRDLLGPALRRLTPDNAQGEYYLTDVVEVLAGSRLPGRRRRGRRRRRDAGRQRPLASWPLAEAELRGRTNRRWLLNGVTMLDPAQTYIDVTVELGRDVTLFPGTILQGRTVDRRGLRDRPRHPARRLRRSGPGAVVENTVGRDGEIGDGARRRSVRRAPARRRRWLRASRPGAFYTGLPD